MSPMYAAQRLEDRWLVTQRVGGVAAIGHSSRLPNLAATWWGVNSHLVSRYRFVCYDSILIKRV